MHVWLCVLQVLYAKRKQALQLPPSTVSSSDSAVFLQVCVAYTLHNDSAVTYGARSLSLCPTPGTVFLRWSDASSCLPPSSVVWRLNCSCEPTTFLLTFLMISDDQTRTVTYVKRFRACVFVIRFYLDFYCISIVRPHSYLYIVKHRCPYFVGALYKSGRLIDWLKLCLCYATIDYSLQCTCVQLWHSISVLVMELIDWLIDSFIIVVQAATK